jgi:putative MATE family efflux protein
LSSPKAKLTQGPVGQRLRELTVPTIWGIFAMMSFNVVDTWFVGRLGTAELAAMSFTFPVVMTLMSVAIGLSAGTSSVIARAAGRDDEEKMRRLTTDALVLATLITGALSLLGYLSIEPVFRLLGASDELLPLVREYMAPWYAGLVFFLVPMVAMSTLRATGDAKTPGRLLIASSVLNVLLDPLLIFGLAGFPRLELAGAAYATVLARAVMLVGSLWILHARLGLLTTIRVPAERLWASWAGILHVGLPAAGTNVIIPVANGVIVALVASFGADAVAGLGVAIRIEMFSLIIFYAMSGIIGPFVGQNLGAARRDRILLALKLCFVFCLALGTLLALAVGALAIPLARLFSGSAEVVRVAATYLWIVPLSYGAAGIIMIVNAAFNGLGRPLPATVISVTRMVVIYIPLALAGRALFGITGVFVAASLSNLLVGAGAALWAWLASTRLPSSARLSFEPGS